MDNPIGAVSCHISSRSVEEIVEKAVQYGLDFVEWFESGDRVWTTPDQASQVRRLSRKFGTGVSFHAPYVGKWSPVGPDAHHARKVVRDIMDRARLLGAQTVTMHIGTLSPGRSRTEVVNELCEVLLQEVARLREAEICFAFENFTACHSPADLGDRVEDLTTLLSALPPDVAGWTLDTGHAVITGSMDRLLDALGERLRNVHLHDSDGQTDGHLPPEQGIVDWAALLARLKELDYRGPLTLEFPETSGIWPSFVERLRNA